MPLSSGVTKRYSPFVWRTTKKYAVYVFFGVVLALVGLTEVEKSRKREQKKKSPPAKRKRFSRKETTIHIFFCTEKGSSKVWAQKVRDKLLEKRAKAKVQLCDFAHIDAEELLSGEGTAEGDMSIIVFVAPTYNDQFPGQAQYFLKALEEATLDPRVRDDTLSKLRFVNIGIGDGAYEESFCKASARLEDALTKLGARQLVPLGSIDIHKDDEQGQLDRYMKRATKKILRAARDPSFGLKKPPPSELEIEDMSAMVRPSGTAPVVGLKTRPRTDKEQSVEGPSTPENMLTAKMRKNLEKEGYRVVGQHSGVKICRWTKNMLRGRGGCYKHTFYGITSSRCMEMTPSLACANKCVFCWRHHTNPVAKKWKWKMDEPEEIVEGVLEGHQSMIKPWKGHALVTPEGLNGALNPVHCALSLVGEPIMYPKINKILDDLHRRRISTFLVTNAQFPDELKRLHPVTQLYLSIDAPTASSLKAVDQPLHKDYWERYLASIDILRQRKDRTIFRITLVKGWNSDSIPDYARLVARGRPSFIEVKGVTYSGHSGQMDMVNIPFHEEVRHFTSKLTAYIADDYELACEHEHSCCVLIGRKDFKVGGEWQTWINYPKFYELLATGQPFDGLEYSTQTPKWALWGASEKGFNPDQKRVIRNRKNARRDLALARARKEMKEDPENSVLERPEEAQKIYRSAKKQEDERRIMTN